MVTRVFGGDTPNRGRINSFIPITSNLQTSNGIKHTKKSELGSDSRYFSLKPGTFVTNRVESLINKYRKDIRQLLLRNKEKVEKYEKVLTDLVRSSVNHKSFWNMWSEFKSNYIADIKTISRSFRKNTSLKQLLAIVNKSFDNILDMVELLHSQHKKLFISSYKTKYDEMINFIRDTQQVLHGSISFHQDTRLASRNILSLITTCENFKLELLKEYGPFFNERLIATTPKKSKKDRVDMVLEHIMDLIIILNVFNDNSYLVNSCQSLVDQLQDSLKSIIPNLQGRYVNNDKETDSYAKRKNSLEREVYRLKNEYSSMMKHSKLSDLQIRNNERIIKDLRNELKRASEIRDDISLSEYNKMRKTLMKEIENKELYMNENDNLKDRILNENETCKLRLSNLDKRITYLKKNIDFRRTLFSLKADKTEEDQLIKVCSRNKELSDHLNSTEIDLYTQQMYLSFLNSLSKIKQYGFKNSESVSFDDTNELYDRNSNLFSKVNEKIQSLSYLLHRYSDIEHNISLLSAKDSLINEKYLSYKNFIKKLQNRIDRLSVKENKSSILSTANVLRLATEIASIDVQINNDAITDFLLHKKYINEMLIKVNARKEAFHKINKMLTKKHLDVEGKVRQIINKNGVLSKQIRDVMNRDIQKLKSLEKRANETNNTRLIEIIKKLGSIIL